MTPRGVPGRHSLLNASDGPTPPRPMVGAVYVLLHVSGGGWVTDGVESPLMEVLARSQRDGYLGKSSVGDHRVHALAYSVIIDEHLPGPPSLVADLGSGGGIPGLVLAAERWPDAEWRLIDASLRRVRFLEWAIGHLGLSGRVAALHARAEDAARDPSLRHRFDCVVARSFAAPPVTAECASPLLRVGGLLVVSDPPPEAPDSAPASRWPASGIGIVGLEMVDRAAGPPSLVAMRQQELAGDRWPRRAGIPTKRPLY